MADVMRADIGELSARADHHAYTWVVRTGEMILKVGTSRFLAAREIASRVLQSMAKENGAGLEFSDAGRLVRKAWSNFEDRAELCEDVSEPWLQEVRGLCASMGIVTDGDDETVGTLLAKLGIRQCFDVVTTSESVRAYKPDPRIYLAALESFGAEPDDSLFVSNSALDLGGADALGMRTALVTRGLLPNPLSPPSRSIVLRSIKDLSSILIGKHSSL